MSELARAPVHRALAEAHRARIVDELDRHPGGLDARELAQRLDIHPNTVRWHLGVLAGAGLVDSHPDQRTTPGRPRVLYTLSDAGEPENYRLLATILTRTLSALSDATPRTFDAGYAWGRYLVDRPSPGTRLSDSDAAQRIADLLTKEGFRAEAREREIRMHRCPFRALAEADDLVCTLHQGLISGALAELGDTLQLDRLDAFAEPQLCIARLARRSARTGA